MKSAPIFASLALALLAAPAVADNGQVFDAAAQARAYATDQPLKSRFCFDGRKVDGVNRAGASTIYVQTGARIYDLQLVEDCAALDSATKITVRSGTGAAAVCLDGTAKLLVETPAGAKRCPVKRVRALSEREIAALAQASR